MKLSIIIAITVVIVLCVGVLLAKRYEKELKEFLAKDSTKAEIARLCVRAEHYFTGTKEGKRKMSYVCGELLKLIPDKCQAFVTQEMLEQAVNAVFQRIAKRMENGSLVAVEQ